MFQSLPLLQDQLVDQGALGGGGGERMTDQTAKQALNRQLSMVKHKPAHAV